MFLYNQRIQNLVQLLVGSTKEYFPKVWVLYCFQKVWVCTLHLIVPFFFSGWVHGPCHSQWISEFVLGAITRKLLKLNPLFTVPGDRWLWDSNFHWFKILILITLMGQDLLGIPLVVPIRNPSFFFGAAEFQLKKISARSMCSSATSHQWEFVDGLWDESLVGRKGFSQLSRLDINPQESAYGMRFQGSEILRPLIIFQVPLIKFKTFFVVPE